MTPSTSPRPPDPADRGRIEHLHVHSGDGMHTIELRCPEGIFDQLRLLDPRYEPVRGRAAAVHALSAPGAVPIPAVRELLGLMSQLLTLPRTERLAFAVALGWTKVPIEGLLARDWPRTPAYDLIHRGKYLQRSGASDEVSQVGRQLVGLLHPMIERHPLLRDTDCVVAVPGHDSRAPSFGERLAFSVARARGVQFVKTASRSPFRTAAKNVEPSQRWSLLNRAFDIRERLDGASVMIVDDVFGTGASCSEVARAARAAGARRVAAVCAVRTLRHQ